MSVRGENFTTGEICVTTMKICDHTTRFGKDESACGYIPGSQEPFDAPLGTSSSYIAKFNSCRAK